MINGLLYKLIFFILGIVGVCLFNLLGIGEADISKIPVLGKGVSSFVVREYTGKAFAVYDGDTFKLKLADGSVLKVRMYGIDAPEKKQDFGRVSQRKLSELIENKEVLLKVYSEDKYGRKVSKVFADGVDVNGEMLKSGLAWHYKQYSNDLDYARFEEEARRNRLGLWKQGRAVSPWDWRKAVQ